MKISQDDRVGDLAQETYEAWQAHLARQQQLRDVLDMARYVGTVALISGAVLYLGLITMFHIVFSN